MFVVILFLLGLSFGYAVGFPKALFAFIVPAGLFLTAADRSAGATIFGFALVAVGMIAGLILAARESERAARGTRSGAGNPVGGV